MYPDKYLVNQGRFFWFILNPGILTITRDKNTCSISTFLILKKKSILWSIEYRPHKKRHWVILDLIF